MGRIGQRAALVLLIGVIVISGLAGVTEPGRTALRTALFIPQVLPGMPVRFQEWLSRAPVRQEVRFSFGDGKEGVGDLYLPDGSQADNGDARYPAVVLFFGVIPAGRDDPRILDLSNALARSGMVVLIPWSEVMTTSRRMDFEGADLLVGAFAFLESHPTVDADRIGISGFCVGASFAALAAEDARIRDRVAYANLFGGYYDIRDLMVSVASNTRSYGGTVEPWQPRDDTREVFTVHLIEDLPNAEERDLLARVFLDGGPADEIDPAALSPHAGVVHRLLSGVTRDEADALFDLLPVEFLEDLERLSPNTLIGDLKAPVLIMHDREDTAIPSPESRRMAQALAGRGEVYYTEFSLFQHLDPTAQLPLPSMVKELWKFYLHMYNVMRLGA